MQTSVSNSKLAIGRTGEFYRTDNQRTLGAVLNSTTESLNAVGSVVLHVDGNDNQVGIAADGNFAGVLISPKTALIPTLDPQAFISNDQQVEFAQAGYLVVDLPAAASIGDFVYYSDTDGTLSTAAPGATAPVGSTRLPGGTVQEFNLTEAGQGVIYFDAAGSTVEPA